MTEEQGTIYREKGRVYEATLKIGNEANHQVSRVTSHINLEQPMPFNDAGFYKTY